ncbi:unnamed protein product [Brachionus calyciflorus]|uniref:Uncharacterized protein n=1 Tax=Brachionus calyciflorus TaxID=104777 RepID=A0A813R579_9BILA|nr:unnamed protein product [Brachionus calyciflorus]
MSVCFIDKKEVNRIVFDIVATMSIKAEKCAIKNGITYKPDSTQVRLADDSLVKVCGKKDSLEENIDGFIFKNEFEEDFRDLKPKIIEDLATKYKDLKGGYKVGQFKIRLKEDRVIFKHTFRQSETEKREMRKKETDELLEAGIIRISDSPYSSPFFIVKKKDGSYKPVIDFKELKKNYILIRLANTKS